MLKNSEPNPLVIHGLRQLTHCPPHFSSVTFNLYVREKDISDWVYENLEGRFYFGQIDVKTDSGRYSRQCHIAFEIGGEASYFALYLTQINSRDTH